MSYKVSSGFVNPDGHFNEDASIIVHAECTHMLEPFQALEDLMTND